MHRALTVAVVLAVVAGSVPAAASLADGTPSTPEPGASFAGVVGVQGAEVDNEVANRSLDRQLRAAESNRSKARVVAGESRQLEERLAELEAEKERLNAAYENGSISTGKYKAQLAVVATKLRAIERRANRTAGVAEKLPPEAMQGTGANASRVREIAQHANRTGGGAVAEAAREIAGNGVGNGLGGPPAHAATENGSQTGPPESAGPPDNAGKNASGSQNPGSSAGDRAANVSNRTASGPPGTAGASASNASDRGERRPPHAGNASNPGNAANGSAPGAAGTNGTAANATDRAGNGNGTGNANGTGNGNGNADAAKNRSTGNNGSSPANASNASVNPSNGTLRLPWPGAGTDQPDIREERRDRNETAMDRVARRPVAAP